MVVARNFTVGNVGAASNKMSRLSVFDETTKGNYETK